MVCEVTQLQLLAVVTGFINTPLVGFISLPVSLLYCFSGITSQINYLFSNACLRSASRRIQSKTWKNSAKVSSITLIEVVSTESINKCKCSLLLNEKETQILDVKPVPSLSEAERRNEKQTWLRPIISFQTGGKSGLKILIICCYHPTGERMPFSLWIVWFDDFFHSVTVGHQNNNYFFSFGLNSDL